MCMETGVIQYSYEIFLLKINKTLKTDDFTVHYMYVLFGIVQYPQGQVTTVWPDRMLSTCTRESLL